MAAPEGGSDTASVSAAFEGSSDSDPESAPAALEGNPRSVVSLF